MHLNQNSLVRYRCFTFLAAITQDNIILLQLVLQVVFEELMSFCSFHLRSSLFCVSITDSVTLSVRVFCAGLKVSEQLPKPIVS